MDDPVSRVWTYAWPLIRAGRLSKKYVEGLMGKGYRWKGDWAGDMIQAIDSHINRPPWPWQARMRELKLASISELALYDFLLASDGEPKITEMRKRITNPAEFDAAILEWERRGWIEVRRTADGKYWKVRVTSRIPRPSRQTESQSTPIG